MSMLQVRKPQTLQLNMEKSRYNGPPSAPEIGNRQEDYSPENREYPPAYSEYPPPQSGYQPTSGIGVQQPNFAAPYAPPTYGWFEDSQRNKPQSKSLASDNSKGQDVPPQPYKFIFNLKAAIITSVIIILTVALGVVFVTTNSLGDENTRKNIPANTTIGADNIGGGKILRLVPRDEWLAEPQSAPLDKLVLPVHRVIIAHTATENCSNQATCTYRTRTIQIFHMKLRDFSDIAYNFLVGGDGCVYEGRGWDLQGAHTRGYNVDSVCIAFIGTFTTITPPEKQLNAAKLLIDEGIRLNKLVPDYRLYGARQLVGSDGPVSALHKIIKSWPRWSASLD